MTSFGNLPATPTLPTQTSGIATQPELSRTTREQGAGFEEFFNDLLCGSEGATHADAQSAGRPGTPRRTKQKQGSPAESPDPGFAAGFPGSPAAQASTAPPDQHEKTESSTQVATSEFTDPSNQNTQPGCTSANDVTATHVPGTPVPDTSPKAAGEEISAADMKTNSSGEARIEYSAELAPEGADEAPENEPEVFGNQGLTTKHTGQKTSRSIPIPTGVADAAEQSPEGAGTTSAKTEFEMQERSSQNKFAGGSWKPATAAEFLVRVRHSESNELPQGGNKPQLDAPPVVDLSGAMRLPAKDDVAASEAPDPFRANRLDHVFQTVLDYLPTIRHSPGGSINVVLRPDADTEISLHLAATNGSFELSAKCDRGDFALLNSYWPELRLSLQQHGVRLLELANSTNTATGGHTNTNFSNSSRHGASQSAAQPDEFLSTPPNSPAGANDTRGVSKSRRATQQKGLLELWA